MAWVNDRGLRFRGDGFVTLTTHWFAAPRCIEFWIRLPRKLRPERKTVFGTWDGHPTTVTGSLGVEIHNHGEPRLVWLSPPNHIMDFIPKDVNLRTGAWEHVSFSATETEWTFSLNGVPRETKAWEASRFVNPAVTPRLGRDLRADKTIRFIGDIDELRIWSSPRTPEQVQATMHKRLTTHLPGLLSYFQFREELEDMDGGLVVDSGPFRNTGTIVYGVNGDPFPLALPKNLWRCRWHHSGKHDFFISYRRSADKTTAELLALYLDQQRKMVGGAWKHVRTFWDSHCLQFGQDWEIGFLNGLSQSKVAVLVVSLDQLKGIVDNATTAQDNVLLEWEAALDGMDNDTIVVPVLVSEKENETFVWPELETFPDAKHASSKSKHASIRDTVQRVMKLKAFSCSHGDSLRQVVAALMEVMVEESAVGVYVGEAQHVHGLSFAGDAGFVQLAKPFAARPLTFECWIRAPSGVADDEKGGNILGSFDGTSPTTACNIGLGINTGGKPQLVWAGKNPENDLNWKVDLNIRTGEAEHICFVVEEGLVVFYHNGQRHAQLHFDTSLLEVPELVCALGRDANPGSDTNFMGDVAELRLWAVPLSSAQVHQSMLTLALSKDQPRPKVPDGHDVEHEHEYRLPVDQLVAYYRLSDASEDGHVPDSGPHQNHGAVVPSLFGAPSPVLPRSSEYCTYHAHTTHQVYIAYAAADPWSANSARILASRIDNSPVTVRGRHARPRCVFDPHCTNDAGKALLLLPMVRLILLLVTPAAMEGVYRAVEAKEENLFLVQVEKALAVVDTVTVLPVLLYENKHFEGWPDYERLGDAVHTSAQSTGATVADTLRALFQLNGIKTAANQLRELVPPLLGLVEEQRHKAAWDRVRTDPDFL